MNTYFDSFETTIGPFSVWINEEDAVVATGFGKPATASGHRHYTEAKRSAARLAEARRQIQEYLQGARREFTLKLAAQGTPFQQRVWAELLQIPYGQTRSYGELAKTLGQPGASRAVGSANGKNPICLIIPCHRVIATGGGLGGFAYGLEMKRRLLTIEQGGELLP